MFLSIVACQRTSIYGHTIHEFFKGFQKSFQSKRKTICSICQTDSESECLKKSQKKSLSSKSSKKRSHEIKIKKINIFSNIISYLWAAVPTSKNNEAKYLIISISPYTFLACILLKLFVLFVALFDFDV